MKPSLLLAPLLLISSLSFADEVTDLQRSINDLKKIVAVQQAEIANLKKKFDKDGSFVAANGKKVIDSQGKWVGDPTGLQGPEGPRGPQGAEGARGLQGATGAQGPQGPGARFDGDTMVLPIEGGVLHMSLQGNECLYKNDGRKRCFH